MDPALSILDRALKGDTGALSFLERTATIYVYDGTNSIQPKICGAWNFLNQALTEVERYESRVITLQRRKTKYDNQDTSKSILNLEAHVQLLATMSRRAARRCPNSDQSLVKVCLNNAGKFHGCAEHAQHLIDDNHQMRDRMMGRIAAITFDFAYHYDYFDTGGRIPPSFSNLVVMDSLCAVVAANAISTGPRDFSNLVLDWIVPSLNNLPLYSVASILNHLAFEGVGKGAPSGTLDVLKTLFEPVFCKILGPMLQETVRESNHGACSEAKPGSSISYARFKCHNLAAMVLKALNKWCYATNCNFYRMKQIGEQVNIDIIAILSDTLYSDSDIVIDALSEILDTLLRQYSSDQNVISGISLAASIHKSKASYIEQKMRSEVLDREGLLSELVSAVGLQRFRLKSRLAHGDFGICRCLVCIARVLAIALQTLSRTGKFEGSHDGMIDLLMKATFHPCLNVYSLALDAFKYIMSSNSDVATKLLPVLQGKAIIPLAIMNALPRATADIDLFEFERFREDQLSEVLLKCYLSCRSYYMESCSLAIEEFCTSAVNLHTPFQIEAALFCLCSVSVDASKKALLINSTLPAKTATRNLGPSNPEMNNYMNYHDEKLSRCLLALAKTDIQSHKNPLLTSQLCRLLAKYAKWIANTKSEGVLDTAVNLALSCFHEATLNFGQLNELTNKISLSPFTEAVTALRNILCRAPLRFTTVEALSALGKGWRLTYESNNILNEVGIFDDRKILCTGITRVLAMLAPDQWRSELSSLTSPTVECIDTLMKIVEKDTRTNKGMNKHSISRIFVEIGLLAITLRTFNSFAKKNATADSDQIKKNMLPILHKAWPYIIFASKTFGAIKEVASSVSDFLLVVVSCHIDFNDLALIRDSCDIANITFEAAVNTNSSASLLPILEFVEQTVDILGHDAEEQISRGSTSAITTSSGNIHSILQDLVLKSFETVNFFTTISEDSDLQFGTYSICRACIRRCPAFLMTLGNSCSIFSMQIRAASSSIGSRRIDIVRSALLFLNDIFVLCILPEEPSVTNVSVMATQFMNPLREDLVVALISGACGLFPRQALGPAGSLAYSILKTTEFNQAERICTHALQREHVRVGDEAKFATILVLGKVTKGTTFPSLIMNIFEDLWDLHQNDDTGCTIAGGDAILAFANKYGKKSCVFNI